RTIKREFGLLFVDRSRSKRTCFSFGAPRRTALPSELRTQCASRVAEWRRSGGSETQPSERERGLLRDLGVPRPRPRRTGPASCRAIPGASLLLRSQSTRTAATHAASLP